MANNFRDPLDDILDRPIAFQRSFKTITGSTVAALFLSQAWYWQKRSTNPDGFFYKTGEEWTEETGLSRSEQETARRILKEKKILQEKLKSVPATLHYRIDRDRVFELMGIVQFAGKSQTGLQEDHNQDRDFPSNINKEPDNTSTTTKEKKLKDPEKPTRIRRTDAPIKGDLVDLALMSQSGSDNGGRPADYPAWPPDVQDLAFRFEKLIDRSATSKGQIKLWIDGFREMSKARILPDDLEAGYIAYHKRQDAFPIKSPASVFSYADEARRQRIKRGIEKVYLSSSDEEDPDPIPDKKIDPAKQSWIYKIIGTLENKSWIQRLSSDLEKDEVKIVRSNGRIVVSGLPDKSKEIYQSRLARTIERGLIGILNEEIEVVFDGSRTEANDEV